MSDFQSHLPVQSHYDGQTFTPSADFAVAVGGYESVSGDFLVAGVTAAREWMVSDTQIAALSKAEDSAHVSGDRGIMSLAVRNDTKGALAGTDGDYIPFQMNASGELYVADETAQTSLSNLEATATSIETSVQLIDNMIYVEDAAHTTGDSGAFILAVRNDTQGSLVDTDGDYAALQVDSVGRLRIVGDVTLGNLEKEEDTAHVSGDIGVMMLGVRQDSLTALAGDGDYIPFSINADGALRVSLTDPGASATEVNDYQTSAAVASAATTNHDYTVTALKTLKVFGILASASGRIKVEVIIDPTGTPVTEFVAFNSTANPNIYIDVAGLLEVAAGLVIRVVVTNLEKKDSQDVYSTLLGHEL